MPWGVRSKVELRLEFVRRAQGGEKISALCREYGVSRPTGYQWLGRYNESGSVISLYDRSHRPDKCPHRTIPKLEDRVCALREKYGWGARKLHELLKREDVWLPIITINRIIKRNGLLIKEDCHRPALLRFEREKPNELWQADFKGPMGRGSATCEPLSVIDDCSRFLPGLIAVKSKKTDEVKRAFQGVFEEFGVPDSLLLDHGVPWWSTAHFLGFSTFSVWLMKQDLSLVFSGINHPQTQGKVERFHRSLDHAVRTKGTPRKFSQWEGLLSEIRYEYNHVRPHEALNMDVPAKRFTKSRKQFNPKPAPVDYPSGSKVIHLDSQGRFRHRSFRCMVSATLANEYVRVEELDASLVVYYRRTIVRELSFADGRARPVCPH